MNTRHCRSAHPSPVRPTFVNGPCHPHPPEREASRSTLSKMSYFQDEVAS